MSEVNSAFIERLRILLEDEEWEKTEDFCNNRLNEDPHAAYAYIGLLLASNKLSKIDDIDKISNLGENKYYKRALMYADKELKQKLTSINSMNTLDSSKEQIPESNVKKEVKKSSLISNILIWTATAVVVILIIIFACVDFRDAETLYDIGEKYYSGANGAVNHTEAAKYFELAATKGHIRAHARLGHMYGSGAGVKRDVTESERHLKIAAEAGDSEAQYELAFEYENGVSLPKDFAKALEYAKKAAAQGVLPARTLLAYMYQNGEGCEICEESFNLAAVSYATAAHYDTEHSAELMAKVEEVKQQKEQWLAQKRITDFTNIIFNQMIKCPAGTFMMGSPSDEFGADHVEHEDFYGDYQDHEKQFQVTIRKDFYIAKYPVTQEQYSFITGENPSKFEGSNNPVDGVSWIMAKRFCDALNNITASTRPKGYCFDLPTEAQWEYACRAGTTTSLNSGKCITSEYGNCSNLDEVGWYAKNSGGKTHPVGLKKPNAWGIYDMHGNIFEICRDKPNMRRNQSLIDPERENTPNPEEFLGCVRGGYWNSSVRECRSGSVAYDYDYGYYHFRNPNNGYIELGFYPDSDPYPDTDTEAEAEAEAEEDDEIITIPVGFRIALVPEK